MILGRVKNTKTVSETKLPSVTLVFMDTLNVTEKINNVEKPTAPDKCIFAVKGRGKSAINILKLSTTLLKIIRQETTHTYSKI